MHRSPHMMNPDVAELETPLTKLFRSRNPVMLAGLGVCVTNELAAAVANAGGIACIGMSSPRDRDAHADAGDSAAWNASRTGGMWNFSTDVVRKNIRETRSLFDDPGSALGVDVLFPMVGPGGEDKIVDVLIEEKVTFVVSAVGVPKKKNVDKLHAAGIICMNMVGSPRHVPKALESGMDVICCQGTEGGGHTGTIGTVSLIPQCVDLCAGKTNFFGSDVLVVAAGGIYDGRGLACALSLGAAGVWLGTRFVACEESLASDWHKDAILRARSEDTTRLRVFTGKPVRVFRDDYVRKWEAPKMRAQAEAMLDEGRLPYLEDSGKTYPHSPDGVPYFAQTAMGQSAGGIAEVLPAAVIVRRMVEEAKQRMQSNHELLVGTRSRM